MLFLKSDLEEPYVPFVSSRHSSAPIHEIRRREVRVGGPRRFVGRALIRVGLAVAGRAVSAWR